MLLYICTLVHLISSTGAKAETNGHFGQGSGPIFFDDLACKGNENSILFCPRKPIGQHNCSHSQDVGVFCETGKAAYDENVSI